MYQVLLADDEYYVRKALINLTDWEALGFHITFDAGNGIEALEKMRASPVDVLITDIRMPKLNGLELIEAAKRLNPQLQCVILSGYDDFAYAKAALRLGVVDYLQKPVDGRELNEVLDAVRKRIQQQSGLRETSREQSEEALEHLKYLTMQQQVFQMLQPSPSDAPEMEGLSPDDRFGVALLYSGAIAQGDRIEKWICRKTGISGGGEALACKAYAHVLPDMPLRVRFLLAGPGLAPADVARAARALYGEFCDLAPERAACAYADRVGPLNALHALDREASVALKSKILMNRPVISSADAGQPNPDEQEHLMTTILSFRSALAERNLQDARMLLLTLFASPVSHVSVLENILKYLYDIICEYRVRYQVQDSELTAQLSSSNYILAFDSQQELRNTIVPQILDFFFRNEGLLDDKITLQIQRHIRQNLASDLRVTTLASMFYLSPNHLSFLYKKETGYALSEYIENARMERAKALLSTSDAAVAQIAQQVGYPNAAYFSRAFKRVTGLSPASYQSKFRLPGFPEG
jgi:two-component system response regulator YesN